MLSAIRVQRSSVQKFFGKRFIFSAFAENTPDRTQGTILQHFPPNTAEWDPETKYHKKKTMSSQVQTKVQETNLGSSNIEQSQQSSTNLEASTDIVESKVIQDFNVTKNVVDMNFDEGGYAAVIIENGEPKSKES